MNVWPAQQQQQQQVTTTPKICKIILLGTVHWL